MRDGGIAFEAIVPEGAVINYGPAGNVIGEIPMEYITKAYHKTDIENSKLRQVVGHSSVDQHEVDVLPISEYDERFENA
jgi:hypothetical protein